MIKKCVLLFLIIVITLSQNIYSKYNYTFNLKAYSFSRDISQIIYNISRTENDKKYTNKDVILTIDFNKEIEPIEGFELSKDKKQLIRTINENEEKNFFVEDNSGNRKEVSYSISNIDKICPQILGVEDGKTYTSNLKLNYSDNIGLDKIFVDKYSNLGIVMYPDYYDTSFYKGINILDKSITINLKGHPKNTRKYKYYLDGVLKASTESTSYKFSSLVPGKTYKITVEAIDENNNVIESLNK